MTDTTPAPDETIVVRPFADWLREQSTGKTHEELSDNLHELIARVRETGKKGTLALLVSIEPMKNDHDVLLVMDQIKLRLPEHDRKASLFYPDQSGNLTRSDPNQLAFEGLKEVGGVGVVDTATGELKELRA